MSLTVLAWLAVAAYALHVLEEHILGWYDWARKTMNISMPWEVYAVTELAIAGLGVIAAMLAATGTPYGPMAVIAFTTLLLINVVFFHIIPMLGSGFKFSPGVLSGVVLFLPLAWKVFTAAETQGPKLANEYLVGGVLLGAALILWPILLLKLRDVAWFSGAPVRVSRPKRKR